MKFTVEFIEMDMVMITFESGKRFFYSREEMSIPEMVSKAIAEET